MKKTSDTARQSKIPPQMYVAQCFEHFWKGQFDRSDQCMRCLPEQWSTILTNNFNKIKKCQENEKKLKKMQEQFQYKLEEENRKSWDASQYVRICNLAANMSFKEVIPAAQKFKKKNLSTLVHSHWELQMLKWLINTKDNIGKIKENKQFAKLSDEGNRIKECIIGFNKAKEEIELRWCAAFEQIFNRDSKQKLDNSGLPKEIEGYMNTMVEMKKIIKQKEQNSYEANIHKIYRNICFVEDSDQMKMTISQILEQIQRKADQILLQLDDFDEFKKENQKLKSKIVQIYDHSSNLVAQHNEINIIAERSLEQKIEQIKENMSALSNIIHFNSNKWNQHEKNLEHKTSQLEYNSSSIDTYSVQKQEDYGKLKQEKSQRIMIEANPQILKLEQEVARLKQSLKEMEISRNTYRDSFNSSDRKREELNNFFTLAKVQHQKIMAQRDLGLAKKNQEITFLENENKKQPQRVDASLQVDISLKIFSQPSESQTEKNKQLTISVESKQLIELIDSSTLTELQLRNSLTQTQPLELNKQAALRQELNWSARVNSQLKQEIRQLKLQQGQLIQHLFTAGGIIDIKDTEVISFLATQIQRLTGKTVLKSKLLVRFDPLNKINMHQYIDFKESLLVLVKTAKGQLIACYSQSPCHPNKHAIMPSLLISLTNKRSFRLIEGKKAIAYDPYTFIFGNHELRFSTDAKVLYSNFAIVNCSFNPEGQKVDCILGENNLKEVPMATYEFYQVEFHEQN